MNRPATFSPVPPRGPDGDDGDRRGTGKDGGLEISVALPATTAP